MTVLTPEQFGAVGDRKIDDTAALRAMFAEPSTTQAPRRYELRGLYKVTETIRIASAPASTVYVDGRGAWLYWAGATDAPCLQIGDSTSEVKSKVFWSEIVGLKLGMLGVAPGGAHLLIDDADFLILDNVVVSAPGRATGIKSLRGNSLDFRSVQVAGADGIAADIAANVFSWNAGKLQQAPIGLRYSGTQFAIRALDLSFLTDCGLELDAAACGVLSFYSEKIGPRASMNGASVLRARNSHSVDVRGAIMNCTWGTSSQDTHCGFGAVLEDCSYWEFAAARFQRPQRAAIVANEGPGTGSHPGCREILLRRSCELRFRQPSAVRSIGPVSWESDSSCW